MPRYALKLEYHGAPFAGWQRQAAEPSVQAALEAALRRLEPDAPGVMAAGRTDAGVHATGQVAHADLARDWDPFRLAEALNHHLRPDPVAVTAAISTGSWRGARHSSTSAGSPGGCARRWMPPRCGKRRRIWSGTTTSPPSVPRSASRRAR